MDETARGTIWELYLDLEIFLFLSELSYESFPFSVMPTSRWPTKLQYPDFLAHFKVMTLFDMTDSSEWFLCITQHKKPVIQSMCNVICIFIVQPSKPDLSLWGMQCFGIII